MVEGKDAVKIVPQRNKSKWCSECKQSHHSECTGKRRLGHGLVYKCECSTCAERRREDEAGNVGENREVSFGAGN